MKNKNRTLVEKRIDLYLDSVEILREFVARGFKKRMDFIDVVQESINEFKSYHQIKKLEAFWSLRVQDESLNTQLRGVLHKIETENLNLVENEA